MNKTLADAISLVEARAKAGRHEDARELFVARALSDDTIPLVVDVVLGGKRCYAVRWRSQSGEVKDFPILSSFDDNADVRFVAPQLVYVTFIGTIGELLRAHPNYFKSEGMPLSDDGAIIAYIVSHDLDMGGGRIFRQVSPLVLPVDAGILYTPEEIDIFGCTDNFGAVLTAAKGYVSREHGVYVPKHNRTHLLAIIREQAINAYANQLYWLDQHLQVQSRG